MIRREKAKKICENENLFIDFFKKLLTRIENLKKNCQKKEIEKTKNR